MSDEELKQECKDWALRYQEKTGKFPNSNEFVIRKHPDDPPPCGRTTVSTLFGSYNNFRKFCGDDGVQSHKSLNERVEHKLKEKIVTESGCWMFPTNDPHAYARVHWKQNKYYMHILSFLYHRDGSVSVESYKNRDTKLQVCHQCPEAAGENTKCFNPAHLELKTPSGNAKDSHKYHAGVKLNRDQLFEIYSLNEENLKSGMSKTQSAELIAPQFDVTYEYVMALCRESSRSRADDYNAYKRMKNA